MLWSRVYSHAIGVCLSERFKLTACPPMVSGDCERIVVAKSVDNVSFITARPLWCTTRISLHS